MYSFAFFDVSSSALSEAGNGFLSIDNRNRQHLFCTRRLKYFKSISSPYTNPPPLTVRLILCCFRCHTTLCTPICIRAIFNIFAFHMVLFYTIFVNVQRTKTIVGITFLFRHPVYITICYTYIVIFILLFYL